MSSQSDSNLVGEHADAAAGNSSKIASEAASANLSAILDTPVWVVIPAAGAGQRLGGELPKQYQSLDGVPMLQRTLEAVLVQPFVEKVVVAIAQGDEYWHTLPAASDSRVLSVVGGQLRADSVLAGMQVVLDNALAKTWVMVHDAARPLVASSDIQRLVNAVYNSGAPGGLLATPVHDTLKRADEYAGIVETVARHHLWQAQTPQMFRAGELCNALQASMNNHPELITDEASAMESANFQPLLVEALQPNFKITRPVDWQLATAMLQAARLNVEVMA